MASSSCTTLVFLACSLLFLIQLIQIWIVYSQRKVGVGKSRLEIPPDQKALPCLTFCPLPAFRTEKYSQLQLMTSPDYFLNSTYGKEEIFSSEMIEGDNFDT